ATLQRPGDDADAAYMLVVDRYRPRQFGAALLALRRRAGLADIRDDEGVGRDALGVAHQPVAARQILDQVVAHAARGLVPADLRLTLHQRALELVAADPLVQHQEVVRVDDILPMLEPVAVLDHADRVFAPQPHATQHDVLAPFLTIPAGVDDVVAREQRLAARRAHIDKHQPAIFQHRIGRLPDIQRLANLLGPARHSEALALCVVEPAVIAAADAALLDPAPFQGGAAMRAMRVERADPPLLVAEHDNLLAQQLFLARQVGEFV